MAIDALAVPFDITWQRLGFQAEMIEKGYGSEALPPTWRSSATIYGYAVPLAETEVDYPDHRIVYLKVSASITGTTGRETLGGYLKIKNDDPWSPDPEHPDGDDGGSGGGEGTPFDSHAQSVLSGSERLTRRYWPCVAAVLQVAVYPRPEEGVADEDYPYIADFEPKKRELYESVTTTGEVLAGSRDNLNVRKGSSSAHSVDVSVRASASVPLVGSTEFQGQYGYRTEESSVTTTDASTERRETAARSTQLSQMYQLWNGYHVGTNRAVFAMFPRPHIVSESSQIENSLIMGERRLEGVQDVFLVVQVPRKVPGMCVRVFLELSHKTEGAVREDAIYTTTRRRVGGCATFASDRLVPVPVPQPPPRIEVVGEGIADGWVSEDNARVADGRKARVAVANALNQGSAHVAQAVLGRAAGGSYKPRLFVESGAFRALAARDLAASRLPLDALIKSRLLDDAERLQLERLKIGTTGAVFVDPPKGAVEPLVLAVRKRLLDAVVAFAKSRG